MEHAIKIESLEKPKEYWDKVEQVFRDFLVDEIGFYVDGWVEAFECRRRSGFIPYSHNLGGIRGYHFSNQLDYYFCPTNVFPKFDEVCEKTYNYVIECGLEDRGITLEEFNKGLDNNCPEMLQERDDMEMSFGEYEGAYFECRLMIQDDDKLEVCFFLNASDAPYFRGYDEMFEFEIIFNSIDELQKKLYNILEDDKVQAFIGLIE